MTPPALVQAIDLRGADPTGTAEAAHRAAVEKDVLFRIRYLIASAYGVRYDELTSRPSSMRAALARSLAIAVARDILCTELSILARHFGCSSPVEAAEHCNLIARRTENDHRFAGTA